MSVLSDCKTLHLVIILTMPLFQIATNLSRDAILKDFIKETFQVVMDKPRGRKC